MGCFGSKESGDNFTGTGRVLGSAPQRTSAPIPSSTSHSRPAPSQPPRQGTGQTLGSSNTGDDPREAAARAAEARASKQQGASKLERDLAAQKKAGMKGALQDASYESTRQRDADAGREARNWS